MRDIDIIVKAMEEVQAVLHGKFEPGPRDPYATLYRMLEILDRQDVVAAQKRLRQGYGQMRIVK